MHLEFSSSRLIHETKSYTSQNIVTPTNIQIVEFDFLIISANGSADVKTSTYIQKNV